MISISYQRLFLADLILPPPPVLTRQGAHHHGQDSRSGHPGRPTITHWEIRTHAPTNPCARPAHVTISSSRARVAAT